MFTFENIMGCFNNPKVDKKRIVYIMMGPVIILCVAMIGAYLETETYVNQYVWYNLLHQMVLNVQVYRLMIANMTNSAYYIIGLENFIALIPVAVHLTCKDKL